MKLIKHYITILLWGLLLPCAIVSCGGGEAKNDSVDTDTVPTTREEEELEEFSSPDLGLWHLTGPVSGAVFLSYEVADTTSLPAAGAACSLDSVTYDRAGLLTSMVSGTLGGGKLEIYNDLRIKYNDSGEFVSGSDVAAAKRGNTVVLKLGRSSGGYLQMIQALGADRELSNSDTFMRLLEWSNGLLFYDETEVGGEGTVRLRYNYYPDGLPQKVVSTIADMGGDTKVEETYTYTARDKYGNWTERRVISREEVTEGEADGTNLTTHRRTTYRLDRRTIYYYPPRDKEETATK